MLLTALCLFLYPGEVLLRSFFFLFFLLLLARSLVFSACIRRWFLAHASVRSLSLSLYYLSLLSLYSLSHFLFHSFLFYLLILSTFSCACMYVCAYVCAVIDQNWVWFCVANPVVVALHFSASSVMRLKWIFSSFEV